MEIRTSTKSPETSIPTSTININHNFQFTCALNSHANLHPGTSQIVINALTEGVELHGFSFESGKVVTKCLSEMNQEVVKLIFECENNVREDHNLFELVEEFFKNSLETLNFCIVVEKFLTGARDTYHLILDAPKQNKDENGIEENNRYEMTLNEWKNCKALDNLFTDEFIHSFQSVYQQQISFSGKLKAKREKLSKKLKYIHVGRKVSNIIFIATFASMLIGAVVAAAMAAPPVAAAIAAAMSIQVGSMGKWIASLFENKENAVKEQKDACNSMQGGSFIAIKDLNNIRILVDSLVKIKELVTDGNTSIREEAVNVEIGEIKNLGQFMEKLEDLEGQASKCSNNIRNTRTMVCQWITKGRVCS